MTGKNGFSRPLLALAGFSLLGLTIGLGFVPTANAQATDSLYVGDAADNTVKRFDASSGQFLGAFVKRSLAGLHGPRGLILDAANNLTIVDQNAATSTPGEVLQYGPTGALSARIVPHSDQHAPAVPRGMILWRDHLFVAEFIGEPRQNKPPTPGRLLKYTSAGNFVADLTPATNLFPGSLKAEFHPRGVVIGPDDRLYVSNVPELPGPAGPGLGGQVLRFDPDTGAFIDVFINSGAGGVGMLNRPEGLVFGPDGNLYITSFRADASDTDKILIFRGPNATSPGAMAGQIELDAVGGPRAFAQALLFGPGGFLFVPLTNTPPFDTAPDAGAVRRYDVATKQFDVLVPPTAQGGALGQPFYLSFGNTDPGTLAYPGGGSGP